MIELLITITIIATLAAMFLGASNAAMESARSARTKTTIGKLHTLLMERWESYTTRRVDFNNSVNTWLGDIDDAAVKGHAMADMRLLATRELMKLEMPDRWSDILGDSVASVPPSNISGVKAPLVLLARPSIANAYLRTYRGLTGTDDKIRLNQGAECLYLTVMLSTGDGEARTLFSKQDIGDTDGDEALEFLDGWGRPIHFIRWPAGYARSQVMTFNADLDHDPFDPFARDKREVLPPLFRNSYPSPPTTIRDSIDALNDATSAYRLVPLLYSSGPDGISDINSSGGFVTELDPYAIDTSTSEFEFGIPGDDKTNPDGDDNSVDNITNHLQDNR